MNVLVIGGTRNMGYALVNRLLEDGHQITLLNRGITRDDLPDHIYRLTCDRTDSQQMRRALAGREFDAVVDMVLYKEAEAETMVELLKGNVGHYVFISTGQVYLVRENAPRPAKEEDYDGPLLPKPAENTYDYEEWLYGMDKRAAEDVFTAAHQKNNFPFTSLRLPMVNSKRDGFRRLYSYILRIKDGGPVLVPTAPDYPLRHIYAEDVVSAVMKTLNNGISKGRAYNISQEETVSLHDFLLMLGDILGIQPQILPVERGLLEANGFLPDCSPFSDLWMSELDNTRSKRELGMVYTPLATYLEKIVSYYEEESPVSPASYRRRHSEKALVPTN